MSEQKINTQSPKKVADNAEKGLELRSKFGRAIALAGYTRASDLKNRRNLSKDTINRVVQYFVRHEVDKKAKNFGKQSDPSAGYIAWLLWGSDDGKKWAENTQQKNYSCLM